MSFNTGNPVPSLDPRDLDDTAEVFDKLVHLTVPSVRDRLGTLRRTWWQMEQDAQALVAPNISAIAGLASTANRGIYFTGDGTASMYVLSLFGRQQAAAVNAIEGRTLLGVLGRNMTLSGDATWATTFNADGTSDAAVALSKTGVVAGTYGSVTVDVKGRVTAATAITSKALGGTGIAGENHTGLTLSNGWTLVASRRAGYRKITSDLVFIEIQISGGTATDGTALCTALPAAYRPAAAIAIPVQSGPNTTPSATVSSPRVVIGADGTIVCQNCSSLTGISFTAVFSTI